MKLLLKFNLIFLLVFVLGLAAASLIARGLLQKVATEEVVDRARLLMEKANAVSTYTATQIKPLLAESLRVFRSCPLITLKDAQSSLQMLAIACYVCALRLDRTPFERAARSRPKNSQALSR